MMHQTSQGFWDILGRDLCLICLSLEQCQCVTDVKFYDAHRAERRMLI
jgi:hypothetical protein